MAGNTFGELFRVTTCGESHGYGLMAIVDGCPPGMELSEEDIQPDLDRRRPGTSKFTTMRNEPDTVKIVSGVFEGKTTGTPIGLLITNVDQKSKDYADIARTFRPGHADYTYMQKYGIRDYRGGGRSSARETAMRVAAGAIAKKYLSSKRISIRGYVRQVGPISCSRVVPGDRQLNEFFLCDNAMADQVREYLDGILKTRDSCGALVEVTASNVPPGLGEPVFGRLDADIAAAMMGINAVKAVEIGDGFAAAASRGTMFRDEMTPDGFLSNHAGGILGGISSGQDIVVRMALKPTSSILTPGRTVDVDGKATEIVTKGRHDPCVGIRAVPVAEAMLALVLMDHLMRNRAQNAEVTCSTPVIPGNSSAY
ncbi:chorismate synthase [Succinimonas amylolytica]|uniref:chorismate synthase n=1 Tax=Succinimonas amylolytica TaxID=83769 RepID=UPI000360C7EC|nr:chorismate synthase [Succinimonas amylolytica]